MNLGTRPKITDDVFQAAQYGLAAGIVSSPIPEVVLSRGMAPAMAPVAPVTKYGEHLGNRVIRVTDGMREQMRLTKPRSVLIMDNLVDSVGNVAGELIDIMESGTTFHSLYYRPHYDPSGQFSDASIGAYINVAKDRLRQLLKNAKVKAAYLAQRLSIKLFNETNIGTEGVPRGRAGFARALQAWHTAVDDIERDFPDLQFLSICPTLGNDDTCFWGDGYNLPYWWHGAEAADPDVIRDIIASKNPANWSDRTRQRVAQAIQSAPMRTMFQRADKIGVHSYGNTVDTTSGNMQTWLSRRHQYSGVFLPTGKRFVISEWDFCHDESPQVRGEQCVWWLANVIQNDPQVDDTTHWWNASVVGDECDPTWEKNVTRKGTEMLPFVYAIANARAGDIPENPDEPDENPSDPDGSPDVWDVPDYVKWIPADVAVGQKYWALVSAEMRQGGLHHIYFVEPHSNTAQGRIQFNGETVPLPLNTKPVHEEAANFPMWAKVKYNAWMEGDGAQGSDRVEGMRLGGQFMRDHDSYFLFWELRTKQGEAMTLKEALIAKSDAAVVLPVNTNAALMKKARADNGGDGNYFVPNSPEFYLRHDNKDYVGQRYENLKTGAVRVYYALTSNFGDVKYVEKN